MGKTDKRSFSLIWLIPNLPFLLTYWFVWFVRHGFFRGEPVQRIEQTNISISQWPIWGVPLQEFDLVIDLTSEMPKLYKTYGKYVALPNLDGVPLCRFTLPCEVNREMRILVHCAQGRGRSAIMTAMLLAKLGYAQTGDEAITMIKQSRPKVSITRAQQKQVEEFFFPFRRGS